MTSTQRLSTVLAVYLTVLGNPTAAQDQGTAAGNRAGSVARLLKELRWHGEGEHEQYLTIRDDRTKRLLSEVDGFITETVSPSAPTAALTARLDVLLGHTGRDDTRGSTAFHVSLPGGRFLIIGVEVSRGGEAISEDAISFRAYRDTGDRYAFVAEAEGWPKEGDQFLVSLNVKALASQPAGSEFWFVAWADVPPRAPYTITMRLSVFDGERFRTVWTPEDFVSPTTPWAVEVTDDGGFTITRMPDPHGGTVITERYFVTADGPQKVAEFEHSVEDEVAKALADLHRRLRR